MGSRRRPLYTTALLTMGLLVLTTVAATAEPHIDLTVVRGDTLRTLCRQLLENPSRCREIYRFNNLKNPDLILPGQKLLVPAGLLKGVPDDGVVTFVKGEVTRQQGTEQHAIMLNETLREGERVVNERGTAISCVTCCSPPDGS
ncbi:MAG: LysM peptidoglycan-binding domain-containing protein [Geobacter sp.]|nr:LysM peptidoglycan-binding domain-containing protein [Geobacter sp.]